MAATTIIETDVRKVPKEDYNRCMKFIDRDDMNTSMCAMWIEKDRNYKNMEVIVLFEDEFFYKVKGRDNAKLHNETLAMDTDFSFVKDFAISIRKKDISSISVFRPPICNCEKESIPHQPEYYELEIVSGGGEFRTIIHSREAIYVIYENIRAWRFNKGIFKRTLFQQFKSFIKNNL